MNKYPLVTVYTINHNYGRYLEQSINSVLNQSYKNIELIIIDDGSNDNSRDILKKFINNKKIKIYYQKKIGLIKSINKAIKVSSGKYIIRLDSDDYFDKDAIKLLLVNSIKNNSSIVFPDYYTVDEDGNILERFRRHNFQKNVTLFNQPAHGACTMYKKNIFQEVGGYSKKYDCQDGVYMWFKVINKYKISNINKPLFYYRQHKSSLTQKKNLIWKTKARIYENSNFIKSKNNLLFFPIRNYSEIDVNKKKAFKLFSSLIKNILEIKRIKKIIISTPDKNIQSYFKNFNSKKLEVFERNNYFSNYGTKLSELLFEFIQDNKNKFKNCDNIILYTWNNFNLENISHLVDNLDIFKLNSVILVKILNKLVFRHDGKGLRPLINYKSGLLIERDIAYVQENGIVALKKKSFLKSKKIIHGKIGHVVLD